MLNPYNILKNTTSSNTDKISESDIGIYLNGTWWFKKNNKTIRIVEDWLMLHDFFQKHKITKLPYKKEIPTESSIVKDWIKTQIRLSWQNKICNIPQYNPYWFSFVETIKIYMQYDEISVDTDLPRCQDPIQYKNNVIFTHIPRTAGSTISYSIPLFARRECYLFDEKSPSILAGHYPYGIHKIFNISNPIYITFLRDPVERCISAFQYTDYQKTELFQTSRNISDYLEKCLQRSLNCNCICRQLSGIENYDNIIPANYWIKLQKNYYTNFLECYHSYSDNEMKLFYKKAVENISKYKFIGFYDNLYNDFEKMCQQFQFSNSCIKTRLRKSHSTLPKNNATLSILREMNKYDIMLYDALKN